MSVADAEPREPSAARVWIGRVVLVGTTIGLTLLADRWITYFLDGSHDEHEGHGHGDEHGHGAEGKAHDEHAESDEHAQRVVLTEEGKKNAGIALGTAAPGKVHVTLSLPGEVRLNEELVAHVTPRVSGISREVKARLGDVVKRGDVLATLDSRELTDISREARASQERVKLAEQNLTRVEKLSKDGIVPEKELLLAKQALAEAKIEQESAAQMLASTGAGGGGVYKMVAPIDGTIIEKHATVGEVLKDDAAAFMIADLSKLWVDVTVYSKDLAWVSVGQPVRIRAEGIREPAHGTIAFISATAMGEARTTSARVLIDNPGGAWKPGLYVTADIAIEEVDAAVVVPEEAVQSLEGRSVIFVVEDEAYEPRRVKLGHVGLDQGGKARFLEVLSGLEKGDAYVEKGAFILKAELGKGSAGHEH